VPAEAARLVKVVFEAENAHRFSKPIERVLSTYKDKWRRANSGKGYLEIPDKANGDRHENLPGEVVFRVNIPEEGTYRLWARVWWMDGCGNSFFVVAGGRPPAVLGEDGTYKTWHWVELKVPFAFKQGETTIVFKNREDGVKLDQVLLLKGGRRYVPGGGYAPERVTPGALVTGESGR